MHAAPNANHGTTDTFSLFLGNDPSSNCDQVTVLFDYGTHRQHIVYDDLRQARKTLLDICNFEPEKSPEIVRFLAASGMLFRLKYKPMY